MKSVKALYFVIAISLLQSCGGGGSDPNPVEEVKAPEAFNLVFPENNTICTEGIDASAETVVIEFEWERATNATSYILKAIDSESKKEYSANSNNTTASLTLPKGMQFSWSVEAFNMDKSKVSDDQWSFYSEGRTEENHSPFPASITLSDNENGTININWTGSDLDNDIVSYSVYLGKDSTPAAILENSIATSISDVHIEYNTTYYLKVISKDSKGNSSTTEKQFNFRN
ncbi:fibronectin type III domain-containing protein [Zhouia amylolytica]|uniref:Fibronectin type-III domain-containing protein n=1 Tax=Zhouia amylolytica AD3 TaxID=1286632 RepID=W2UK99_9FLAO|nr:fibronectin type III domain-containing protein [Zhouia amylolytica]ETN94419.1 hypothetical protein P278_23620 [Zhouia amylolytica AD3]